MRLGLRWKLAVGFGGVLGLMLVMSGLSLWVLSEYSRTLDRFLRENYRSVIYMQRIAEAVDRLAHAVDLARHEQWTEAGRVQAAAVAEVETNLQAELNNITLSGELEAAGELRRQWEAYRPSLAQVLDRAEPEVERARVRGELRERARGIKDQAQIITQMNLENMVREDGEVKRTAAAARTTMILLLATGSVIAVVVVVFVGRAILHPLRALTSSAREIEDGNLDLVVPVPSRDEIGHLAEAFNAMAAKLRELRRTNRAKLIRIQRTMQLAVNSLPDAVAVVSAAGMVELANDSARRNFGLQPDQPLAAHAVEGLVELYRRAMREGKPITPQSYAAALQVFGDDGMERFFLPHARPIAEEGIPLGVTLVLADVTTLRHIDEMKTGLLSTVSHELKTPLTSLRMATHLLLEERVGPLNAKQQELVLAAREDSERLHRIVEGLLDMSRLESGRVELDMQPVPAEELVETAIEPLRAAYRDKGVTLETAVAAAAGAVWVDRTRMQHVFANLLDNALRFTPAGGTVRVTADADADDRGLVRFAVSDTGSGIPCQHLGRVFERFFRVPGQRGQSGAGLGLAIAKDIVEAHGGHIRVESTEGAGARLEFTLRAATGATRPEVGLPAAGPIVLGGRRDDDATAGERGVPRPDCS